MDFRVLWGPLAIDCGVSLADRLPPVLADVLCYADLENCLVGVDVSLDCPQGLVSLDFLEPGSIDSIFVFSLDLQLAVERVKVENNVLSFGAVWKIVEDGELQEGLLPMVFLGLSAVIRVRLNLAVLFVLLSLCLLLFWSLLSGVLTNEIVELRLLLKI